jgi:hypothetical protein
MRKATLVSAAGDATIRREAARRRETDRRLGVLNNRGIKCPTCLAAVLGAAFRDDLEERAMLRLATIEDMTPKEVRRFLRDERYRDVLRRLRDDGVIRGIGVGQRLVIEPPGRWGRGRLRKGGRAEIERVLGTQATGMRTCAPSNSSMHPKPPMLFPDLNLAWGQAG